MERLTQKQSAGYDLKALNGAWCNHYCHEQRVETCNECGIYQAIQKLAYYEDLEEQGRLQILTSDENNKKYYRRCSICGKEYLQEDMYSSPNGLICVSCDIEMYPEEYEDENE